MEEIIIKEKINKSILKQVFNNVLFQMTIILLLIVLLGEPICNIVKNIYEIIETKKIEAISQISLNTNVDFSTTVSPEELWENMKEQGYDVEKYLDSPEELATLLNAEKVMKLVDTGNDSVNNNNENNEKFLAPITDGDEEKGDDSDFDSSSKPKLEGIVRFKRHDENGREFYLTYVEPGLFQEWIEVYARNGNEKAKNNILTHFTLKKSPNAGSSDVINGSGSFTHYNLSDEDLRTIAIVCVNENGEGAGAAAEASLIANRYEMYGSGYSSIIDYLFNCGWFEGATSSGSCSNETLEDIRKVLNEGLRTFPKYIDEHVTFASRWISWAKNSDGYIPNVEDRNKYKMHETVIQQSEGVGGGKYTFYSFPTEYADPFGYTDPDKRQKYGDFCYEYGTWKPINGTEDKNATDIKASGKASTSSGTSSSGTKTSSGDQKISVSDKIVETAKKTGSAGPGWCLQWADNVYENAGLKPDRLCCAHMACDKHVISKDKNSIPIGAAVYGLGSGSGTCPSCGRIPQHVGIYIGNGQVMDNQTSGVVTSSLEDWLSWQGGESAWLGWGWEDTSLKSETATSAGSGTDSNGYGQSGGNYGYQAVVGTWRQVDKSTEAVGPNVEDAAASFGVSLETNPEYTINTTAINYEKLVEPYTLQFDFLWALLVMGQSKDFVFSLAELAYESTLDVSIYDNITITTDVDHWTYNQKTDANIKGSVSCEGVTVSVDHEHDPLDITDEEITKTVVTKTDTIEYALTEADTWIAKYEKEYKKLAPKSHTTTGGQDLEDQLIQDWTVVDEGADTCGAIDSAVSSVVSQVNTQYQNEYNANTANMAVDGYAQPAELKQVDSSNVTKNITVKTKIQRINIHDATSNTVEERKYTAGKEKAIIKDDKKTKPNFVTLFNDYRYRDSRNSILSATDWIFEVMEENEKLANTLQNFKYLLYKATGTSYEVTELDTKLFYPGELTDTGLNVNSSDFLAIAKEVHDYVQKNNYTYKSVTEAIPPNSSKIVDCSGYVCAVLQKFGYTEFGSAIRSTDDFWNKINGSNFEGYQGWKVYPASQMQAGDILLRHGHTAIYIGNDLTYDCGDTPYIQSGPVSVTIGGTWEKAIRVTKP